MREFGSEIVRKALAVLVCCSLMAPEAALGGPIALVEEGDEVVIDVARHALDLNVAPDVLAARRARWSPPAPRYKTGVMAKYAAMVSSASLGAVTTGDRLAERLASATAAK